MAWRSSGLKPKKKAAPAPETPIHRSPTGKLRVSDPAYMAALHAARNVPPLDLRVDVDPVGVCDLHHGPNPDGKARRANDAACVKLDHAVHMAVDAHDGPYKLPLGTWAALHYFSYRHGCLEDEDRGQLFLKWVLERLEEEDD